MGQKLFIDYDLVDEESAQISPSDDNDISVVLTKEEEFICFLIRPDSIPFKIASDLQKTSEIRWGIASEKNQDCVTGPVYLREARYGSPSSEQIDDWENQDFYDDDEEQQQEAELPFQEREWMNPSSSSSSSSKPNFLNSIYNFFNGQSSGIPLPFYQNNDEKAKQTDDEYEGVNSPDYSKYQEETFGKDQRNV